MGCSTTKVQLEEKIEKLKLERATIREQKKKKIDRLEKLKGEEIKKLHIPDYLENSENNIEIKKNSKK